jgi:hypothetical protein
MSGYTDEAIVQHGVLDANVKFIQKTVYVGSPHEKSERSIELQRGLK